MSASKPKIVVRAASAAKVPAASTVSIKTVAKPAAKAAAAPRAAPKKVAVVQHSEEEAEYEEEPMMTPAQIIASMEEQLASLRVALKMKGLTKTGKPRKQREYTGPSDKQAAWNAYVQEVREEHGFEADEDGNVVLDKKGEPKYSISYKEAMQIAGERRKLEAPAAAAAAAPAKTAVKVAAKTAAPAAAGGAVKVVAAPAKAAVKTVAKPAAAAAPAVRKTAAELRAEFLAKKAAQAEAEAAAAVEEEQPAEEEQAAEEEASNEAVEWEFEGQTYFKTGDNLCWLQTEDGGRIWAGVYLAGENRIDDSVEEPQFDE
jgi:hypothetical protein